MTPRSAAENERVREEQRRNILDAAAKLFARRGLAGTRVSDIAEAAGVSHGLVHHYFGTKENLFAEIVESTLGNATSVADEALALDATPWQRVEHIVRMMMLGAEHAPELFMLVVQAGSNEGVPSEIRERADELGAAGVARVGEVIAQAQAAGSVRPGDPLALAGYLGATVQGLAAAVMAGELRGGSAADFVTAGLLDADVVLGLLRPTEGSDR